MMSVGLCMTIIALIIVINIYSARSVWRLHRVDLSGKSKMKKNLLQMFMHYLILLLTLLNPIYIRTSCAMCVYTYSSLNSIYHIRCYNSVAWVKLRATGSGL